MLALLALDGCARHEISAAISNQLAKSNGKTINLVEAAPSAWERVCVLGPYSDNVTAQNTLGFEWDVESKTSIKLNEGISLLLFVQDNKVVAYVEHPRRDGDFSNLTTKCFPRQGAQFFHDPKPSKGWPGLFPKDTA